jgi:hypothetical protein
MIQSPVLVGRDSQLALIEARQADTAGGAGRLLFVAGEAGIGKSRLLGSAARRAQRSGFAVVRAAAFPGDVQSYAGLLLDLASSLASAREPVLKDVAGCWPRGRGRCLQGVGTRTIGDVCWCKTWLTP